MATSRVQVTEGSGKNVATYSATEDSVTKDIQRVGLNNSSGTEIGTSSNPIQVSLANTGSNSTAVKVDNSAVTQPISHAALTELAAAINGSSQMDVNIAASSGTIAVSNAGLTELAGAIDTEVQVDVVGALPAGDNNIGNVDLASAIPAGTNAIGKLAANSGVDIGDVDVTSISAGTNLIGDIDVQPRTTGGWSVGNFTSGDTYTALTNSAQVIKASAGKFGGYYIYNPNSSATYVLIYNVAAASVTVGTTTARLVFCIPALAGANLELLAGIPFDTAMSIAATTTGGGNSAPSTALEAMVFYK